jgi:hypothetical protein
MASIVRDVVIQSGADEAWDALSDFGAVHERLAPGFVTGSHLEAADIREVTFHNGAVARERLVGVDHEARRLAYSVVESGLNPSHHNACAQVVDLSDGRIRFVWVTDVLPDELAAPIASMMDQGIEAIKQALGGDRKTGGR